MASPQRSGLKRGNVGPLVFELRSMWYVDILNIESL